jgi:diguanylate cyclase (GGDEF)-like protein
MNLHVAQLAKLIAKRQSTAVFGVVIIAMLWAGVALKYFGDVQDDEKDTRRTNHNFAMVFEENVLRSIGEIDKALLYLRHTIETRKDSTDFYTIVNTTDVLSEIIVQVAIIDAQGIMRASNVGPQPPQAVDLSDREHFRAHLNSTVDQLFISKPVVGRVSGKWSVQFTRRFLNKDNSFAGVVVASLDPAHLTKFYNKIDFGSTASISLIGDDGVVRSSGGNGSGLTLGQDLKGTELWRQIHAGRNATFEDFDSANGERRLITVRKVKDHPLWVSVNTNMDEVYRNSWYVLEIDATVAGLLTLMILGALERILRTEAKARQKAEQLELTLEHMNQGILLVTKDLQIPVINGRCCELLDLPADFVNNPCFDKLIDLQIESDTSRQALISTDQQTFSVVDAKFAVCERAMPNGSIIEIRSGQLPDGGCVQTFTDITKRREAEAHIARLASEDPLTGLPNRRVFRSALDEISQRRRAGANHGRPISEFAVIFLDLDRFKLINDSLGHGVGDRLLQEVATRLKRSLGAKGILARLGGDEFAVLVPVVESHAELEQLANGLIESVDKSYEINDCQIRSSVSIGIAIGPCDGKNADDLLMAADLALYAVKAGSRGSYKFYQPAMNKVLNDRREIEVDLRDAIERREELELHYQPILDSRRNVITGFEALARWRHPVKGMVPPAVFIPVAEDSGLILPLGEWALREACRTAALWPSDLKIAVNLSPVQFSAPKLFDIIQQILTETKLAPHRLELEITEGIFIDDNKNALSILRRLKELGVRIALDDFGTGYSSLSYLRNFPFDKIKVDRSFVMDLAAGTEHVVIVQAVVSIARALGMTTTAEGVETSDQHQFLVSLGCDELQGYLFSAPVSMDKIPEILAKWKADKKLAA